MRPHKLLLCVLALAACFLTCACKPTDVEDRVPKGLLRVASSSDMSTMDVANNTANYLVPMNIFDRLFETRKVDGVPQLEKSLCEDYSVSEDGLTYDFTLRKGVRFSNGDALTSRDVKYSFERLLILAQQNTEIALEIKGGQALMDHEAKELEGFRIVDDTHFQITLEAPNAGFPAELSAPAMSVVCERTTREAKRFGIDPAETIGSGPYYVSEWVVNDHYTFEYNENYWGEKPDVERCVVRIIPNPSTQDLMYENGELDLIELSDIDATIVQRSYKVDHADSIVAAPQVGMTYMALNENNKYLKDKRVRQAIMQAVDVETICKTIYAGDAIPQYGIMPTGLWGHNDDLKGPGYDPEAARKLIAEAGYEPGEISFELSMSSDASQAFQLIAQAVSQYLKDVGIDAHIKAYDFSAWLDQRRSGDMDSFITYWLMDYNDPANIMYVFFGSEANTHSRSINYPNTQVMDEVAACRQIVDDDERMAAYQRLEEKIVSEDRAWMPLLENSALYCLGDRVESFTPHWAGWSNFYIKDVDLK